MVRNLVPVRLSMTQSAGDKCTKCMYSLRSHCHVAVAQDLYLHLYHSSCSLVNIPENPAVPMLPDAVDHLVELVQRLKITLGNKCEATCKVVSGTGTT